MEALRGSGPAFASGLWGMSEVVEERLARIEGKFDKFAERVEVWTKKMAAPEDSKNDTMAHMGNMQPHVFTDTQKHTLVSKLVGGNYEMVGRGNNISSEKHAIVEQVLRRHAARNGTYFPEDEEALVRRARMLVRPPNRNTRG